MGSPEAGGTPTWADNTADVGSAWSPRRVLGVHASPWPRGPLLERAVPRRPAETLRVSASHSTGQGPNVAPGLMDYAARVAWAAPAMPLTPVRGGDSGGVVANSGAPRAGTPLTPVSREPGGSTRSRVTPSTPADRPSLPLPAPVIVVHRDFMNRGTTRVSRAAAEPWIPPAGLLEPGRMTSATAGDRSDRAPWPFRHDASLSSGSAASGREAQSEAPSSLAAADTGLGDGPDAMSSRAVLSASRPGPSEPPRISRAVLVTPRPATTGAARTAAGHDTTALTLRSRGTSPPTWVGQTGILVTHRQGYEVAEGRIDQTPAANVLTVREGMAVSPVARSAARLVGPDRALSAGRMDVSVGSGEGRFAVALAGLNWPSVERPGAARASGAFLSHRARSFGVPGPVPWSDRRPDDRAPDESGAGAGAVARSSEPRFDVVASSGRAGGEIERKVTISELGRLVDAREVRPSTAGGGHYPTMAAVMAGVGVSSRVHAPTTTLGGGSAPPSGAGSPALFDGVATFLMGRGSSMLVERAVARRTALERGFETLHLATHRESRPGWFLAQPDRPPVEGVDQARSASRYGAGWPTAPALVARSPGVRTNSAAQSPDAGTLPPVIGSMEMVALGWGSDVRPVASVGRPQTPGPTAVIATMRSMTLSRPALRTVEIPADGPPRQAALPGATGERELLLAARPAPAAGDHVTAIQRASEFSVQAAASTPTVSAEGRAPVGAVVGARVGGTQADASSARIDLDELVDRAWQKLMHKVTIEQERRGYTR